MKKTLIALAALASTAAFAQSSVTISGRLDMGASSIKTANTDADGVAAASVTAADLTGAERARTGGRLTFSGVEDLGGGLKAGFDYTANLYSGIAASPAARRANISLSGGFGTVAIGSFDSNALDAVRGLGAATAAGAGGDFQVRLATGSVLSAYAAANGVTLAAADAASGLSGATSNAILYALPAMGNLSTSVTVVSQSRVADTATPVTAAQKVSAYLLGASYVDGPLTVKFGYGNAKRTQKVAVAPAADAGDFGKVTDTAIGASYNLGSAVPYITYETAKAKNQDAEFIKTTGTEVGVKFPMGALTPYITVNNGKISDEAGKFGKVSAYQVGATYDLSKRTYFYANLGQDKVSGSQAGDATVSKRTGYNAGLVHQF